MSGIAVAAAMFCAATSALNVALYVSTGGVVNLAAAVFCGFLVLINCVIGARS